MAKIRRLTGGMLRRERRKKKSIHIQDRVCFFVFFFNNIKSTLYSFRRAGYFPPGVEKQVPAPKSVSFLQILVLTLKACSAMVKVSKSAGSETLVRLHKRFVLPQPSALN